MTYNNAPLLLLLYLRKWKLRFFWPRNFRRENRFFGIESDLRDIGEPTRSFVSAALYKRELCRFSLIVTATFRQRFFCRISKHVHFLCFFAHYSANTVNYTWLLNAIFCRRHFFSEKNSYYAAKIKIVFHFSLKTRTTIELLLLTYSLRMFVNVRLNK